MKHVIALGNEGVIKGGDSMYKTRMNGRDCGILRADCGIYKDCGICRDRGVCKEYAVFWSVCRERL